LFYQILKLHLVEDDWLFFFQNFSILSKVKINNLIKDYLLFTIFPEIWKNYPININLSITANASLNNYSIHNLRKVLGKHPSAIN